MTTASVTPIGLALTGAINGVGAWLALWALGAMFLRVRGRHSSAATYQWGLRALPAGLFYGAYSALLASTREMLPTGPPLRHALDVVRLERALHVWWEPTLSHAHVPGAWAYYYVLHLVVTLGLLIWVGTSRPDVWRWARNALGLSTGVALVCWSVFPTDPPRLLPAAMGVAQHGLGGLDTVGVAYAALPSLHTAWAAWVAVVLWRVLPGRWGWIGPVYAATTAVVVLVTGNHYIADVAAGEGLAVAAGWVSDRMVVATKRWPRLRWGPVSDRDGPDPISEPPTSRLPEASCPS